MKITTRTVFEFTGQEIADILYSHTMSLPAFSPTPSKAPPTVEIEIRNGGPVFLTIHDQPETARTPHIPDVPSIPGFAKTL